MEGWRYAWETQLTPAIEPIATVFADVRNSGEDEELSNRPHPVPVSPTSSIGSTEARELGDEHADLDRALGCGELREERTERNKGLERGEGSRIFNRDKIIRSKLSN